MRFEALVLQRAEPPREHSKHWLQARSKASVGEGEGSDVRFWRGSRGEFRPWLATLSPSVLFVA